MKRFAGTGIIVFSLFCLLTACDQKTDTPEVIHVELERYDSEMYSIGQIFTSDPDRVNEQIEKNKPILPAPFPPGAQIVYSPIGPFLGIMEKTPGDPGIRLILDVNLNNDLTDDESIKLPTVEDWEDGVIVKIGRTYDAPDKHTEYLPYRIGHQVSSDREGNEQDSIFICSNYRYQGKLHLGSKDYGVRLMDGDCRGRFIKEKVVNVFIQLGLEEDMNTPGKTQSYRPFELARIGDKLYEFKDIAEDGSWLEIAKSGLPIVALGQKVPEMEMTDLEGESFHLSDYSGKSLLLDFWPVWCKPCIAKFPDIKKMVEQYADKPFAVIGINIDDENRVEAAKKVIADYELNWRQVVEGKGEFIPPYQVLGRLPERKMAFPVYVLIDGEGVARYATNDYKKMEKFLGAHFSKEIDDQDKLFIPLSRQYTETKQMEIAVDFDSPKVQSLKERETVILPENLSPEARLGLLPNGTVLLHLPGSDKSTLKVILDADRNGDLTNGEETTIPVLTGIVTKEQTAEIRVVIAYSSGARGFNACYMFARWEMDNAFPRLFFIGTSRPYRGEFYVGRDEYSITIQDPTADHLFTEEDALNADVLKLSRRKKGEWKIVYKGVDRIPIGKDLFRIRRISDDGQLIELEPIR